ncbi:cystathionine beta-lyase [Sphingomonas sp. BN140010]|uniref:Cystathionine beta-lyase n=1 Tax=Sphingomonas arvum TaxID=2992113 RepID=A0ABT3JHY3_9SPHN|nr:cystathionine beta-lyase [Sphingomonas sp. BN140010]MCW3798711.1 cystathionine beta-lyase [Sphingomonas sp. BN140010]
MSDEELGPLTRLVHGGRRREWRGKLVNVPVERTSTVLFDNLAELRGAYPPRDGSYSYGRNGTATQWALCDALTALEPGAAGTRLFPSGAAAVAMALISVLGPGDELLMVDSAYAPSRFFCEGELKRLGVTTRYYHPLITPEQLRDLVGPHSRALFLESPGSLTFEVQDVPGLAAAAKELGLVTLLDNSCATSLFFPAIARGVDLSITACTKYIGGHSDVMLGAVTASPAAWEALNRAVRQWGTAVSPDDAWLALRGLRTLDVRLRRHEQNALEVGRWLAEQPRVQRVLHPALPSCPGHEHFARDFAGSTGLFAIVLDGTTAARDAFIERLTLFGIGWSWGGYESLASPVDLTGLRSVGQPPEGPTVRLHIGLEDPADLIADLAQALA